MYNIILHTTTSCNYNCSYCDVIKDNKDISKNNLESILLFLKNNKDNIGRFKFFGGEPLIRFDDIKYIVDKSNKYISKNYEIVTNTSLLTSEIGEYFEKYFKIIFFSIDTENDFNYVNIINFINKHNLKEKVYFNLVINPGEEEKSLEQFKKLYNLGIRNYNILPVYFTKIWSKRNLQQLSKNLKYILDLSIKNNNLNLYGFQENLGKNNVLINESIFIDIDAKVYYSDIVSTNYGEKLKNDLFLSDIEKFKLNNLNTSIINKKQDDILLLEKKIYNSIQGQKELKKIMDYFSTYLNKK